MTTATLGQASSGREILCLDLPRVLRKQSAEFHEAAYPYLQQPCQRWPRSMVRALHSGICPHLDQHLFAYAVNVDFCPITLCR